MSVPPEAIVLPAGPAGTLQQRIRQAVVGGIVAGRFRAGDRMPSSRALALHLGISRITVTLAYAELVASDYLAATGRSGYFVSDTAPRPVAFEPPAGGVAVVAANAVDWAALAGRRFSGVARVDKPADWARYPYNFIYGQTDPALFDHANWRACALRAMGRRDFLALTSDYFDADDPMLIEMVVRMILPRRGIAARPTEVLLTLGAQNGLWLAAQVLLGPGSGSRRRVVMEEPGYPGLRAVLASSRAEVVPVAVDADGLPPEGLDLGAGDAVFVTPSHQSPTNATMPVARRRALLAAASARGFVVVEDDYEFEMSFLKSAAPALKSLDAEGRVVHVGSFSKSLFPGLRLGWLVAPEAFVAEARALRSAVLRHPPGHVQRTAAYFLQLGHYDALVTRMKAAYRRRRLAMLEAIRDAGLTVAGPGGFGGSSVWMAAPEGVDTEVLALRLRGEGVLIEPGRAFFAPGAERRNFYRLAYSSVAPGRIAEGIGRIARVLAG